MIDSIREKRTFASALRATDHATELSGKGPFTIFAPSDEAFHKFSTQSMDELLEGNGDLFRLLMGYHFANGKVSSARFKDKRIRATMHDGGHLVINGRGGLRANAAHIVEPDIEAANGVIHRLDAVLWPRQSHWFPRSGRSETLCTSSLQRTVRFRTPAGRPETGFGHHLVRDDRST
jgi:uncharacterized surface protein with fasciclin (FAS1) repeats